MRKLSSSVALLAALALGACGGQARHTTIPASDVIAAASTTRSTPSERLAQNVTMKVQGKTLHIKADGVFDNRRRSGHSTMDMSDVAAASGQPASSGRGEIRLASPTKSYFRMPYFSHVLKVAQPWVEFDLQKLGRLQGVDLNSLMGSGSGAGDPSQSLDQLRATSGGVEVIGHESVRGVPTTHYRATIDMDRYPAIAPAAQRAAARKTVDRLKQLGTGTKIKTDIWVAQVDKRVRRVESKYSYTIPGSSKIDVDQTTELYDFGVQVPPVAAPPADQVADLAALAKKAQAGSAGP